MKKYQVISLDMFQTLVDVNQRIPEIWQGVLEKNYTEEKGIAGAKAVINNLPKAYAAASDPFCNMEQLYTLCAESAIAEAELEVPPDRIVYHLMYQHGFAPFYEEVLATIEKLTKEYQVIISSDANHFMIDPILQKCNVDKVFISDDLGAYKGDHTDRFFKNVLSELNVSSDKILHIGDSFSDIQGAYAAGIDSCWINRSYREWKYPIKPDYEVHRLDEVLEL